MTKKKANPRPKCKSTTNNKEWKEWRKTESSINLERPLRIAHLKHDENDANKTPKIVHLNRFFLFLFLFAGDLLFTFVFYSVLLFKL